MANVKHTLFMTLGSFTWSESYYDLNNSVTNSNDTKTRARALGVARANILGAGAQINSIRCSLDSSPRATTTYFSDDSFGNTPWTPANNSSLQGNSGLAQNPDLCIVCEMQLASYPWRAIKYLSGIPSGAMVGPRSILAGSIAGTSFNFQRWFGNFNAFISDGSWGINVKLVNQAKVDITSVTLQTGTNYLNIQTGAAVGLTAGNSCYLRGIKSNVKAKGINGTHKVLGIVNNAGVYTYTLSPTIKLPVGFVWAQTGTIEPALKTQVAISLANPLETSHRKRGKREGSPGSARA